ncbi:uncharacterized protein C22orf46-like [Rhynchocyon petersi]
MLLPLLGACVLVGPFQGPEWEPVQGLLSQCGSCRDPRCCGNLIVLCLFLIWQVRHYWQQFNQTQRRKRKVIQGQCQGPHWGAHTHLEPILGTTSFTNTCLLPQDNSWDTSQMSQRKKLREIREEDWVVIQGPGWGTLTDLPKGPALKKSRLLLLESLMRRKIAHLRWGLPHRILQSYFLLNFSGSCPVPTSGELVQWRKGQRTFRQD